MLVGWGVAVSVGWGGSVARIVGVSEGVAVEVSAVVGGITAVEASSGSETVTGVDAMSAKDVGLASETIGTGTRVEVASTCSAIVTVILRFELVVGVKVGRRVRVRVGKGVKPIALSDTDREAAPVNPQASMTKAKPTNVA